MFRRQVRTESPLFAVAKNKGVAAVYIVSDQIRPSMADSTGDVPFLFFLKPTNQAAQDITDGTSARIRPYVGKREDLDKLLEGRPYSEAYGPGARHVPFSFGGLHEDDVKRWQETGGHNVKTRWDYEQLQKTLEAYDQKRKPLQRLKRAAGF